MKKILILIPFVFICSLKCSAEDSKELKLFGITVNYHDGSWVNPDEPEFKIRNPDSWIKRNYIRNYLQGSKELRSSLIDFEWEAMRQASKSGQKIPLKKFISVLDIKRALNGIRKHPEGILVTTIFALNATSDSLRDGFWIMRSTFRGIKVLAIGKKKISKNVIRK